MFIIGAFPRRATLSFSFLIRRRLRFLTCMHIMHIFMI
jgi:hypothetical protein